MLSALNLGPGEEMCWYIWVVWFPSQAQQDSASEGQREALNRKTRSLMFLAVEWKNWAIEEMTEGWSISILKALQNCLMLAL